MTSKAPGRISVFGFGAVQRSAEPVQDGAEFAAGFLRHLARRAATKCLFAVLDAAWGSVKRTVNLLGRRGWGVVPRIAFDHLIVRYNHHATTD